MKRSNPPMSSKPATKRSRLSSITSTTTGVPAPEVFPHFAKGLVNIILDLNDTEYHYQFHRAVLERCSGWFLDNMRAMLPGDEDDSQIKGQAAKFKFVLEKRDEDGPEQMEGWVLVRKVSSMRTSAVNKQMWLPS